MEQKVSNYEKMKENMAAVFLGYDQEEMIRKFALEHSREYMYIPFVGRLYRIERLTGLVDWSEDSFQTSETAGYNEVMTIYDVLCCSSPDCHPAGKWVNLESLSSVRGGTFGKSSSFFHNAGEYFQGRTRELAHAFEKLQGRKIEKGDVGYEIELFPFLSISLHFWDADEDFPASFQILVDENILDFMHYETLMFAVTHLFNRLKDGAGVKRLDGGDKKA